MNRNLRWPKNPLGSDGMIQLADMPKWREEIASPRSRGILRFAVEQNLDPKHVIERGIMAGAITPDGDWNEVMESMREMPVDPRQAWRSSDQAFLAALRLAEKDLAEIEPGLDQAKIAQNKAFASFLDDALMLIAIPGVERQHKDTMMIAAILEISTSLRGNKDIAKNTAAGVRDFVAFAIDRKMQRLARKGVKELS